MYRRLPDWDQRLAATVRAWSARPFDWSAADCTAWAGACVEAVSGCNPHEEFRPRYATADEAAQLMIEVGGLIRWARRNLGPARGAQFARRGDLVAARLESGVVLAPCLGMMLAVPGIDGLRLLPRARGVVCWRIG